MKCIHLSPQKVMDMGVMVGWVCHDCGERFDPSYFKWVKA